MSARAVNGAVESRRARLRLALGSLVVNALVLGGCSPRSPWPGVSLNTQGEIEIYSKTCDDRTIGHLYVREESATATSLGSRTAGAIVWEAKAIERGARIITVRNDVPGYDVLVPLPNGGLDLAKTYSFQLKDEQGVSLQGVLLTFVPAELDSTAVLWTEGLVAKADWFSPTGPPPCVRS